MKFFKSNSWGKPVKELSNRSKSNCKRRAKKKEESYPLFEEFQTTAEEEEEKAIRHKNEFRKAMRNFSAEQCKRIREKIKDPIIRKIFYKYFNLTGCPKEYTYFLEFLLNKCNYRDFEKLYNN